LVRLDFNEVETHEVEDADYHDVTQQLCVFGEKSKLVRNFRPLVVINQKQFFIREIVAPERQVRDFVYYDFLITLVMQSWIIWDLFKFLQPLNIQLFIDNLVRNKYPVFLTDLLIISCVFTNSEWKPFHIPIQCIDHSRINHWIILDPILILKSL